MKRSIAKQIHFLLISAGLALSVTACGGHSAFENSMAISDEAKLKMFKEPTDVLTPTTPENTATDYSVYKLVEAKFGTDANASSVSAQIKIVSTAGTETVDLVGGLRADGTASLVDLHPLDNSKNRLVAEALCVDVGTCKKIILNVYYNVASKTMKKQFSSESLRMDETKTPPSQAAPINDTQDGDELHPSERNMPAETDESDVKLGDFVGAPRNEILIGRLWPRSKTPELPPVLSRAEDPQESAPSAVTPAAPVVAPTVATPPSSSSPAAQAPNPAVKKPAPKRATVTKPVPHAQQTPAAPAEPKAKPAPVKLTPETEGAIQHWLEKQRWLDGVRSWLAPKPPKAKPSTETIKIVKTPAPVTHTPPKKPAPPVKTVKPAAPAQPSAPIKPAPAPAKAAPPQPVTPPSKPTVAPPVPPAQQPDPSKPKPQPAPAHSAPGREEKPHSAPIAPVSAIDATVYPFPPAQPISTDLALDQKISLLEAHLAPLINLRDGGISQGGYANSDDGAVRSAIVNASLLPTIPGLVPITINTSAHYGSGMLVSFLENAATYLFTQLHLKLFVGDMSLKFGGSYGASSAHNTHQNGLDADIAWLGIAHPLRDSALNTRGTVVDNFDYQKTWDFLRLAAKQEIIEDAQKSTAISRVFMSPQVKVGFCAWAKQGGLFDDPFNADLMRLVRPVRGHYKHFHLSLKCSPHYPLCRNLAGPPPPGTGCPAD